MGFRKQIDRLDQSENFAQRINKASTLLAKQRGFVPVIGIGFLFVGIVLLLVNVFVSLQWLQFIGILLQGLGTLATLIGLLLAEPLGR